MTLIDYLKAKYPSGNFGIMACECRAFGIKYPLQTGWLEKHRNDEITTDQLEKIKQSIAKRKSNPSKKAKQFLSKLIEV